MEEQAVGHIGDCVDMFSNDPVSGIQLDFAVQLPNDVHVELVAVVRKLVAVHIQHPLSRRDAAAAGAILELVHGR